MRLGGYKLIKNDRYLGVDSFAANVLLYPRKEHYTSHSPFDTLNTPVDSSITCIVGTLGHSSSDCVQHGYKPHQGIDSAHYFVSGEPLV